MALYHQYHRKCLFLRNLWPSFSFLLSMYAIVFNYLSYLNNFIFVFYLLSSLELIISQFFSLDLALIVQTLSYFCFIKVLYSII